MECLIFAVLVSNFVSSVKEDVKEIQFLKWKAENWKAKLTVEHENFGVGEVKVIQNFGFSYTFNSSVWALQNVSVIWW